MNSSNVSEVVQADRSHTRCHKRSCQSIRRREAEFSQSFVVDVPFCSNIFQIKSIRSIQSQEMNSITKEKELCKNDTKQPSSKSVEVREIIKIPNVKSKGEREFLTNRIEILSTTMIEWLLLHLIVLINPIRNSKVYSNIIHCIK